MTVPVEQPLDLFWLLGWECRCWILVLHSWPCTPSERCAAPLVSSRPQLFSRCFHFSSNPLLSCSVSVFVFFIIVPHLWSSFFSSPSLFHLLLVDLFFYYTYNIIYIVIYNTDNTITLVKCKT